MANVTHPIVPVRQPRRAASLKLTQLGNYLGGALRVFLSPVRGLASALLVIGRAVLGEKAKYRILPTYPGTTQKSDVATRLPVYLIGRGKRGFIMHGYNTCAPQPPQYAVTIQEN